MKCVVERTDRCLVIRDEIKIINANEYFDLCFAARWMLDYVENSRKGAFVQLDDYLDTYLKGIADEYGRDRL